MKAAAHEDLIALADDVQKLEQPVEANREAKQEYTQALDFYDKASGAYDRVDPGSPTRRRDECARRRPLAHDVRPQSLLDGRTPPDRRPPCFFDPRHGPSARDVDGRHLAGHRGRFRPAKRMPRRWSAARSRRHVRSWPEAGWFPTGARHRTSARGPAATSCRSAERDSCPASSSASCWAARSAAGATAAGAEPVRQAVSATGATEAEVETAAAATSAAGMSFGGGDFGGGSDGGGGDF